jgi:hypothetical protein
MVHIAGCPASQVPLPHGRTCRVFPTDAGGPVIRGVGGDPRSGSGCSSLGVARYCVPRPLWGTRRLESRMREIRTYDSEGGAAQSNAPSLPLSHGGRRQPGKKKPPVECRGRGGHPEPDPSCHPPTCVVPRPDMSRNRPRWAARAWAPPAGEATPAAAPSRPPRSALPICHL